MFEAVLEAMIEAMLEAMLEDASASEEPKFEEPSTKLISARYRSSTLSAGMEPISLASFIVQITQIGVEFFSRFLALSRSANGSLREFSDRESQIKAIFVDVATLGAVQLTQGEDEHVRACQKVLEQMLKIVNSTKGKGKRHVISNARAAARTMRVSKRFEQLDHQLNISIQGLQLSADVQHTQDLQSIKQHLETLVQLLRSSLGMSYLRKPNDLGYPWETGAPDEHICVDDGLDQGYYLPLTLCSSRKEFLHLLSYKFKNRGLPGAILVQQSHLELWTWDSRTKLDNDTWNMHVISGKGIKVSFVMSTCFGFDHYACVRCGQKQEISVYRRKYSTCSQCKLELRWVEPDEITYETTDIALIPFNGDIKKGLLSEMPDQQNEDQSPRRAIYENDTQTLEKVCRRLTMKWEPIFNYTHRYLYCRCILRRSTPSSLCPEITLLVNSRCPRHNSERVPYADYGDIDYRQDPYFHRFGGYNAFRGMIFAEFPGLYLDTLGRYAFIDEEELDRVVSDLKSAIDRLGQTFLDVLDRYKYEIYEEAVQARVSLPSHAIDFMREWEEKEQENRMRDSPLHPDLIKDFLECPMMQEVKEIQLGRWSRKPHWTVDNC